MIHSRIAGTGSCLPQNVVTNADLEKRVETSDEWIAARTGIRQRHIAEDGETTGDLAFGAATAAKRMIRLSNPKPNRTSTAAAWRCFLTFSSRHQRIFCENARKRNMVLPIPIKSPSASTAEVVAALFTVSPFVLPIPVTKSQPVIALKLEEAKLSPAMAAYFKKCQDKLGFVPNVLLAYAFDMAKLETFVAMYNDLMLGDSGLSKLEREMIAVAVSSQNRCYYCLTAHGAAVRQYSGNPLLGEHLVMNYRVARLNKRQRAMLDFAVKLTASPWSVEEGDRERLRRVGFTDREIWDISAVAGFFNMSNRVASATDMRPNPVYHGQSR